MYAFHASNYGWALPTAFFSIIGLVGVTNGFDPAHAEGASGKPETKTQNTTDAV